MNLTPAVKPTMYFIGVTTGKSSIMKVFPEWAKALGIDAVMSGIDIAIHEKPEVYREVVEFLKNDPLSMGALVTTHKIDIYNAAHDLFDVEGDYAKQFGEISSIYKRDGKFCCDAKDPITCGMAMEEFVPENYWKENPEAGVMIMGAGGSCISMCCLSSSSAYRWVSLLTLSSMRVRILCCISSNAAYVRLISETML